MGSFKNTKLQVLYKILEYLYCKNTKLLVFCTILEYLYCKNTKLQGLYTILQIFYCKQYKITRIVYNTRIWLGAVPECGQLWSLWTELSWDWIVSDWKILDWNVSDWNVLDWSVWDWNVLDWIVRDWKILDWTIWDWKVLDWIVLDWIGSWLKCHGLNSRDWIVGTESAGTVSGWNPLFKQGLVDLVYEDLKN